MQLADRLTGSGYGIPQRGEGDQPFFLGGRGADGSFQIDDRGARRRRGDQHPDSALTGVSDGGSEGYRQHEPVGRSAGQHRRSRQLLDELVEVGVHLHHRDQLVGSVPYPQHDGPGHAHRLAFDGIQPDVGQVAAQCLGHRISQYRRPLRLGAVESSYLR